jgi:hypothetical protein
MMAPAHKEAGQMRHRSVWAALAATLGVLTLLAPAAPSAAEDTVTYSATVTVPAPPASDFPGATGGGDGWAVALSSTRFYNVFHHASQTQVNCRNQADASQCWEGSSSKVITAPGPVHFRTSISPGLYLDQATGKLFVPVTRASDDTGGILCIDTSLPDTATGAEMYCGFTALTGAGESPQQYSASNLNNPIQVGSRWYVAHPFVGTPTAASQNAMLCFDLSSFAACGGQPYALDLEGATFASASYSPPMGWSGDKLFLQATSAPRKIVCFDTTTNGACDGTWPVTAGSGDTPPPFPLLDGNGVAVGVCDETPGVPCFDFAGNSVATPPGMAAAIPPSDYEYGGAAVVIGPRVYQPNPATDQVHCYDYKQQEGCANFPHDLPDLGLLYTVNRDPYRPACLWVNADNGSKQIQNFDAFSGGPCGQGAIRVLTSSIVVPQDECIPASWTSLQVLAPERGTYSSGTVAFQDASGNGIPGFPDQSLDGTGAVDLSQLEWSTANALPQFLITLEDAGDVGQVQLKLTWTGTRSPDCDGPSIDVTLPPVVPGDPVPPVTPTVPPGYRIGGLDGGVFTFGQVGFAGSLGAMPINGRIVGIVATPSGNGYWLVAGDGGVFSFGDAGFFGSAPGLGLNVSNIVGMIATPTGNGYWLIQRNGGVFSFGDAMYHGSAPELGLTIDNVVGGVGTPTGGGYFLAQRNGGVLTFGDAAYRGSAPEANLLVDNVVGIGRTLSGGGYWLAQRNGGVLSFGDAAFFGSIPGLGLDLNDVVGIAVTRSGGGYYLVKRDGGVITFGDAVFFGALALSPLNAPPVGLAT